MQELQRQSGLARLSDLYSLRSNDPPLPIEKQENVVLYSGKVWRALNLANWLAVGIGEI